MVLENEGFVQTYLHLLLSSVWMTVRGAVEWLGWLQWSTKAKGWSCMVNKQITSQGGACNIDY